MRDDGMDRAAGRRRRRFCTMHACGGRWMHEAGRGGWVPATGATLSQSHHWCDELENSIDWVFQANSMENLVFHLSEQAKICIRGVAVVSQHLKMG